MKLLRAWTVLVLTFALSAWTVRSVAQTPAEITLARELFTTGVEAARAADWPRALNAFERSYALYAHPETLFNIAGACQRLGQLVAASEAYRSFLRSPTAAADAVRRSQAEASLGEMAALIARVGIRVQGIQTDDVLLLDGQVLSRGTLDSDLPIDPGAHVLRLLHAEKVVGETLFEVHARERIEVLLVRKSDEHGRVASTVLTRQHAEDALLPSAREVPMRRDDSDSPQRPLLRKWWLWTAVGAVIAGGVTATLLLTRDDSPRELRGNVGTGVVEVP